MVIKQCLVDGFALQFIKYDNETMRYRKHLRKKSCPYLSMVNEWEDEFRRPRRGFSTVWTNFHLPPCLAMFCNKKVRINSLENGARSRCLSKHSWSMWSELLRAQTVLSPAPVHLDAAGHEAQSNCAQHKLHFLSQVWLSWLSMDFEKSFSFNEQLQKYLQNIFLLFTSYQDVATWIL